MQKRKQHIKVYYEISAFSFSYFAVFVWFVKCFEVREKKNIKTKGVLFQLNWMLKEEKALQKAQLKSYDQLKKNDFLTILQGVIKACSINQ